MKSPAQIKIGIRTGHFTNTAFLLKEVLNLEMTIHDTEIEFAQIYLSSGGMMEVFGSKNIWHPFTTSPDWEVIIADIRYMKEKRNYE